jgi:hypothetical protein
MSDTITIPANLVKYRRSGVRNELAARVAVLTVILGRPLDAETYDEAIGDFDVARSLLEMVGLTDEKSPIDLNLHDSPLLVLKALEHEHQFEVQRLQDAKIDRLQLPELDVAVLGSFVATLRRELGVSASTDYQQESFFEKRAARRRKRKRGDG